MPTEPNTPDNLRTNPDKVDDGTLYERRMAALRALLDELGEQDHDFTEGAKDDLCASLPTALGGLYPPAYMPPLVLVEQSTIEDTELHVTAHANVESAQATSGEVDYCEDWLPYLLVNLDTGQRWAGQRWVAKYDFEWTPVDVPPDTRSRMQVALDNVDEHGFGEDVDDDALILQAAKAWLSAMQDTTQGQTNG